MMATVLMDYGEKHRLTPIQQKAQVKGVTGGLKAFVTDEAVAREAQVHGK